MVKKGPLEKRYSSFLLDLVPRFDGYLNSTAYFVKNTSQIAVVSRRAPWSYGVKSVENSARFSKYRTRVEFKLSAR